MIYHQGFQIPSCEHIVGYIGDFGLRARWVPAGGTLVERWVPAHGPLVARNDILKNGLYLHVVIVFESDRGVV